MLHGVMECARVLESLSVDAWPSSANSKQLLGRRVIVAIAIPVFRSSVSKEQRYGEPQHSIPSQKWTPKENFHVAK